MYFSLLLVIFSNVDGIGDHVCNGKIFQTDYYETQTLFKDFGSAHNLVMQESSGHLFFSHGDDNLNRRIVCCHVNTSVCNNVTGIPGGGHTLFYHRYLDKVYFGGHSGIYEYTTENNTARFVGANYTAIWSIFTKLGDVCYIEYPSRFIYKLVDGESLLLDDQEEYENYYVTKHLYHYFTNKVGELYKIEQPARFVSTPILLSQAVNVSQFTEDVYGIVYICAKDGIYIDDVPYRRLEKILDSKDLNGCIVTVKFSHTNIDDKLIIIYSDKTGIHKFYPSQFAGYCKNKLLNNSARMGRMSGKTPASKSWLSFSIKVDYD